MDIPSLHSDQSHISSGLAEHIDSTQFAVDNFQVSPHPGLSHGDLIKQYDPLTEAASGSSLSDGDVPADTAAYQSQDQDLHLPQIRLFLEEKTRFMSFSFFWGF